MDNGRIDTPHVHTHVHARSFYILSCLLISMTSSFLMDVNELVSMVFSHLGCPVGLPGHIQHCAEENPLALRGLGLVTENTSIGRWNRSSEGGHHTHTPTQNNRKRRGALGLVCSAAMMSADICVSSWEQSIKRES